MALVEQQPFTLPSTCVHMNMTAHFRDSKHALKCKVQTNVFYGTQFHEAPVFTSGF